MPVIKIYNNNTVRNIRSFFLLSIALFILLYDSNDEIISTSEIQFWAFLHILLHSFIFSNNIKRISKLYSPYILFISLFNLLIFGVTPFFVSYTDFQLGILNSFSLQISFYGYTLFYFILFLCESNNVKRYTIYNQGYPSEIKLSPKEVIFFNWIRYIFFFLYLLAKVITLPVNELENIVVYYTCGLLLIGFYLNINKFFTNVFFISILVLESFKTVSSGLVFPLVFLLIFLLVIAINTFKPTIKNIISTSLFVFFVTLFIILFSNVKMDYRSRSSGTATQLSYTERAILMNDLIFNNNEEINQDKLKSNTQSGVVWRLSYSLSALSLVLEQTPETVPFWNGESYAPLLTKWIPRFVWPDKPQETMGQEFGHTYRILADDNLTTSMNTPILAEAYMNFSYVGFFLVFIIMAFLIGNIFFRSNLKMNTSSSGLISIMNILKVGYLTVVYCQWESNLSMMLGKILILFIIDTLLTKYLIGKKFFKAI